jgi:hypothetical protein
MRAIGQADRAEARQTSSTAMDMIEIAEAQPAPFLLHGDAVQAERAHRLPQFAREAVLAVDFGGERHDLFVGKAARRLADHQFALSVRSKSNFVRALRASLDRHRLAARADLVPDDVASEIMIARRSCEILAETSRFFTAHGVRPFFLFRAHNDDRCLALVRSGAGVTTAPVSLATPGVVAIPLKGYDFRRRLGLVWRDDNARTAAPPQLDVAISAAFA